MCFTTVLPVLVDDIDQNSECNTVEVDVSDFRSGALYNSVLLNTQSHNGFVIKLCSRCSSDVLIVKGYLWLL